MTVVTTETNMVGSAATPSETAIWTLYDVASEQYVWVKVIENVQQNFPPVAKITGDGQRVLAVYQDQSEQMINFAYLRASDGAQITTYAFKKQLNFGLLQKDGLVLTNTGANVYFIMNRPTFKSAVVAALAFDGSNSVTPWSNQGNVGWNAYEQDNSQQKYAVVLSTDESRLISFSTGLNTRMDCRYDVWDVSSLPISFPSAYNKGERTIQNRNCRFPAFVTVSSMSTAFMILVMTEYYKTNYAGFLRISLKSNYEQVGTKDEEHKFTGYNFRFTSAFYPTTELAYAMAVDQTDSKNWLVRYDWNDPNKAPELFPLKGLSESPNQAAYAGLPHLDSVIYATQSGSKDFKVKGWIVGSAKSVWAYDDCLAPDFGITVESYKQIVSSPGSAALGYLSKLDLDVKSCNHEHVNEINLLTGGGDGTGMNDQKRNMERYTYNPGDDEDLIQVTNVVKDLSATSPGGISAPAWESSIDLTECQKTSADETFYDFVAAVFDGNDIVEYEIGGGNKNVDFTATDWYVSGNLCTLDLIYTVKIGPSATITASTPTSASKVITIATSDVALNNVDQTVTVLGRTPSYQCVQKDFTIKPFDCLQTLISGAFWLTSVNPLLQIDYTILDSGAMTEQFKWVSSMTGCSFASKIERETSLGSGVWNAYTDPELTYALQSNPAPGQHVYLATIQTNDISIDTGGFIAPVWSFKITIGTPTLSGQTKEFKIEITFKNRCRDAIVDLNKIFPIMEAIIGAATAVKYTVPQYTFTGPAGLSEASCGTQSIKIYEDGAKAPLLYSSFITASGMELSLQSNTASHAGDYYLKVEVSWSGFPVQFRNDHDLLVRLKRACNDDTFSNSKFIVQNSASIAVHDHAIGIATESYNYSPIVNQLAHCTITYTLQEEVPLGSGTWVDYSGPLFTHTQASQLLEIKSTSGDQATLDQVTKHFRLGVSSVTPIASANSPTILDIIVRFMHPCRTITFLDHTDAQAPTNVQQEYWPATYPAAEIGSQNVNNFTPTIDYGCGAQTITVLAAAAITPGSLADFVSIAKPSTVWQLSFAPTNSAQQTHTYTLKLAVSLTNYPTATLTSSRTFTVEVLQSCAISTISSLVWTTPSGSVLPQETIDTDNVATSFGFTPAQSFAHCAFQYELRYKSTGLAYNDPHITVQGTAVVAQSNLGTLHNQIDNLELVAKVLRNPSSFLVIELSIKWNDACIAAGFKEIGWTAATVTNVVAKLKNEAQRFVLKAEPKLSYCVAVVNIQIYVGQPVQDYAAYTDLHVTLDKSLAPSFTITAQSSLKTLDTKVQRFRLSVVTGSDLTRIQYFSFQVEWRHVCWFFAPVVSGNPYPDNPSIVVHGPQAAVQAPTITTFYDGYSCGVYSYKVWWPLPDRIRRIATFYSGAFTMISSDPLDAGFYNLAVDIYFDDYPTTLVKTGFQLIVSSCLPDSISPPIQLQDKLKLIHVIDSEYPTTKPIGQFLQVPTCGAVLRYELTDAATGKTLDQDLKIETLVAKNGTVSISVDTLDAEFAGLYKLKLMARTDYGGIRSTPYELDVELTLTPEQIVPNTPPVFQGEIGIMTTLPYTLPAVYDAEGGRVAIQVFLGDANSFISYDPTSGTFSRKDGAARPAPGTYSIIIVLEADSTQGKRSSTFLLDMVFDADGQVTEEGPNVVRALPLAEAYLIPEIVEIDTYGEVTIEWNMAIRREPNDTYFEEQLKRKVWTQDIFTGKLVRVPAFEVDFVDTFVREVPIEMDWSFLGWESDTQMKLQLVFDRTEAVSMDIPSDYLNVTFWDQNLFIADFSSQSAPGRLLQDQDFFYVEKQMELSERVPPQVAKGDLADGLSALSSLLAASILTVAGGGTILSIFFSHALSMLWQILHALQLTVHLPLFVDQFPGFAQILFEVLIMIAKIDVIETSGFVPEWFDLDADEEPYNFRLAALQYKSRNFLMNSGSVLLVLFLLVFLVLITSILKLLTSDKTRIGRCASRMHEMLFWNTILRHIIELSLEFSIISFLDIKVSNFSTSGYIASYAVSWATIGSMVIFILAVRVCIYPRYDLLKKPQVAKNFGNFYDGLNVSSKQKALFLTTWFVMRRIIFGIATVYTQQHLWLSLQILFSCSVTELILVGQIRPYESVHKNRLELFNEMLLIVTQYHLICFSDLVQPAETRSYMGLSCFFIVFFSMCVLVSLALHEFWHLTKLVIKRNIARRQHRERMRQRQARFTLRNLTIEELREKVVQEEVKAKETQYLSDLVRQPYESTDLQVNPMAKIPMPKITISDADKAIDVGNSKAQPASAYKLWAPPGPTALQTPRNVSEGDDEAVVPYQPNLVQRGFNHDVSMMFPQMKQLAPMDNILARPESFGIMGRRDRVNVDAHIQRLQEETKQAIDGRERFAHLDQIAKNHGGRMIKWKQNSFALH